jgi:myo-inositol-1(or 4)-monophosphatase
MAPGIILVREAGGVASSVTGGPVDVHGGNVCVSNGHIQAALVERLNRALEEKPGQ